MTPYQYDPVLLTILFTIILLVGLGLAVLYLVGMLLTYKFDALGPLGRQTRLWMCKALGWHVVSEKQGLDGASMVRCKICDKAVLQDSQGNWV